MGKYEKKSSRKPFKKYLISGIAVLGAVILTAGIAIMAKRSGNQNDDTPVPEQTIQTTEPTQTPADVLVLEGLEEQGDQMILTASYCTLRYPFAYSDLLRAEVETDGRQEGITFFAQLRSGSCPVFTVWFSREESRGFRIGTMTLPVTQDQVGVWVEIIPAPEGLTDAAAVSFAAAQECVNDVIESLEENGHFIPET